MNIIIYICKDLIVIHINMQTFRELVYMVMDELKLYSDDSNFTEDHIIMLLVKYRAFLLKQKYSDIRKTIPESNYQDICLELMEVPAIAGIPCEGGVFLKSKEKIPFLMTIGLKRVYTDSYYKGEITYITKDRMRYTGYNKYLANIVYCSVGPDDYLYFKFSNEEFLETENVHLYGIFQDCARASELQCDKDCELIDRVFPLEDTLVPTTIELTLKELLGAAYRPEDKQNDASDDLSEVAIKK